jgi:TM2 domain-containing membrane protein YozV
MADASSKHPVQDETEIEIDLKDPRLAAFLAWLVPGLGHIYQGRTGKGVLFFVCILGSFVYGMWLGGGRVVYASSTQVLTSKFPFISREFAERWQYACQVGVGIAALPAYVQTWRDESGLDPLVGDNFMRPPRKDPPANMQGGFKSTDQTDDSRVVIHPDELAKWNYDLGDLFELGTVFTVIAGLLNILAICDAYGGPLVIPPPESKKKDEDKTPESAASAAGKK